jgi:hypothetical protein
VDVEFHRTGERRYAITIRRRDLPPVAMDPAPGYDPVMPHDLLHLIVERELGLARGIFGQVAAGGHAGTFVRGAGAGGRGRAASRRRRRAARRGDALLREGRDDAAQSERATCVCLVEWLARSQDPARRGAAARMAPDAERIRSTQSLVERRALDGSLDRICARLDDLGARWAELAIGDSFVVDWPEPR